MVLHCHQKGCLLTAKNVLCVSYSFQPGVFKQASDDVMKERKIIKPKRKLGSGVSNLHVVVFGVNVVESCLGCANMLHNSCQLDKHFEQLPFFRINCVGIENKA